MEKEYKPLLPEAVVPLFQYDCKSPDNLCIIAYDEKTASVDSYLFDGIYEYPTNVYRGEHIYNFKKL